MVVWRADTLASALSGALFLLLAASNSCRASTFDGTFEFRWLSTPERQHREMKLLSDVSFTDESDRVWPVPAGTEIDGASIPPVLWTFAGSPFVGNYR